jgi:hypothetical protein
MAAGVLYLPQAASAMAADTTDGITDEPGDSITEGKIAMPMGWAAAEPAMDWAAAEPAMDWAAADNGLGFGSAPLPRREGAKIQSMRPDVFEGSSQHATL